jgi:hypothetical protein
MPTHARDVALMRQEDYNLTGYYAGGARVWTIRPRTAQSAYVDIAVICGRAR